MRPDDEKVNVAWIEFIGAKGEVLIRVPGYSNIFLPRVGDLMTFPPKSPLHRVVSVVHDYNASRIYIQTQPTQKER